MGLRRVVGIARSSWLDGQALNPHFSSHGSSGLERGITLLDTFVALIPRLLQYVE
jgi:hypothetical protein